MSLKRVLKDKYKCRASELFFELMDLLGKTRREDGIKYVNVYRSGVGLRVLEGGYVARYNIYSNKYYPVKPEEALKYIEEHVRCVKRELSRLLRRLNSDAKVKVFNVLYELEVSLDGQKGKV